MFKITILQTLPRVINNSTLVTMVTGKLQATLIIVFTKAIQNIANIIIRLIFISGHKLLLKTHRIIDLKT